LPCQEIFESVKRITSGGEKFNEKTILNIKNIFPNAKITNVYASTETGTLFASENDTFILKSDFESLIKIENGELLIHRSLLGNSNINMEDWYHTGDIVDVISNNPLKFRFQSRKSDMINVGGYNVNPTEVEEVLSSFEGIKNVRVFAKGNSVLGNIICCEVTTNNKKINESLIRDFLRTKMQEYKIPRVIKFVEELSTTRTGKIKRN
jgi:acyl-coenzyme A synthetase/AMP-(fatty) acid ligase